MARTIIKSSKDIVKNPALKACAIVDVPDIDYAARRITHDSADRLIEAIQERQLKAPAGTPLLFNCQFARRQRQNQHSAGTTKV